MARIFWAVASVMGLLGVALGAFGAHALKGRLSEGSMAVFQVGVQYHFIHALALLATALLLSRAAHPALLVAGWCFIVGTVLFSGSLYTLAISGIRVLGAITPLGGVAFLLGWSCLAWAGTKILLD